MSTSLFSRTVKTNIILYKSNGQGRDTYISYNNGGFWKDKINPVQQKEENYHKPSSIYHSWGKTPAIWTYHSDGSGRDSYVIFNNGGLMKKFNSMADNCRNFLKLEDNSKKDESFRNIKIKLSKDEKIYLRKINKIQKDLVNRLYNSINNNKTNLRKKIICCDRYKLKDDNSNNISFDLKNINPNSISLDLKDNNICKKSSSQIFNKKQLKLKPIKLKNKLCLFKNNNKMSSNSVNNIYRKNMNIDNGMNNKKYNYRRKFIYDTLNNKFTKCPKVKCSIDQNEHKNN